MPGGCGCTFFNEVGSGGIALSGAATVHNTHVYMDGGATCSGSARVQVATDPWDDHGAVYHLQEVGAGVADEYKDSARWLLHGQGGDGTTGIPGQTPGVFCLNALDCTGSEYITLPQDKIDGPLTVSMWFNPHSFRVQRGLFTRGYTDGTASKWVYTLGHSIINHVWAKLNTTDGTTDTVYHGFTSGRMQEDAWHHIAATWTHSTVSVYINGQLDGTAEAEATPVTYNNGNYIARYENGSYPIGYIQEVRLQPVRSQAWLQAERENMCKVGWYVTTGAFSPVFTS